MELRLSAFADEATADFKAQIGVLQEERIPWIELRGLDGKNVSVLGETQAKEYASMLRDGGISVWAIGSPLGKIGVGDDFAAHMRTAEHVFSLARIFGCDKVRIFSFYTDAPERDEEEVFERLRRMQAAAKSYGVTLYHENEKEIYGDTAPRCAKLLAKVPDLRCVFDPANYVQCGQDAGEALIALRKKIGYYHIKDALAATGEIVSAGQGDGRINELVAQIDGDTVLTLEPHLAVFDGYANIDRTQLKHKFSFASPRQAFGTAAEALRVILRNNGYHEEKEKWIK